LVLVWRVRRHDRRGAVVGQVIAVPGAAPVFAVEQVSYRYQAVAALDSVSLAIEPGKRVALLGANGSGKSTLLRLLDGLYFPHSGAISFHGQPLGRERLEDDRFAFDFRRRVGLVFQNPDVQLFNPTVFDEVAFAPLQLRLPKEEVVRRVAAALDLMEIAHLKHRPPHRLSGGEKKRVALASVLVLDPEVLLLDEPAAALDPRSQSQIIDLLIGWGDGSKTVITATHDLGLVEDIADYCFLLQQGKLVAEGAPDDLLRDQALLERANLIHAHRHRHAGGRITHSHPHTHPHRHE
jgi:cobalt/nickel transport system ATP-binding protein